MCELSEELGRRFSLDLSDAIETVSRGMPPRTYEFGRV